MVERMLGKRVELVYSGATGTIVDAETDLDGLLYYWVDLDRPETMRIRSVFVRELNEAAGADESPAAGEG